MPNSARSVRERPRWQRTNPVRPMYRPRADKIGSGSYGIVYKALRKVDRMVYAMKEIDLQGMSRKVGLHAARTVACCAPAGSSMIVSLIHCAGARGVHQGDSRALQPRFRVHHQVL